MWNIRRFLPVLFFIGCCLAVNKAESETLENVDRITLQKILEEVKQELKEEFLAKTNTAFQTLESQSSNRKRKVNLA